MSKTRPEGPSESNTNLKGKTNKMTNLMNDEYYYAHENYYVGVDPASKSDYTGIAVLGEVKRWKKHALGENAPKRPEDTTPAEAPQGPEILYLCNHCERVPIGTEY